MKKINIKDFASLKTIKNQINKKYKGNEVENIFRSYITEAPVEDTYYTTHEAWDNIKYLQKAKVVKFNKEYFLFNYDNHFFPFFFRKNYLLNDTNKFLNKFGEDVYKKIGEFTLLNQTQLKKILKLKSNSSIEEIVSNLPEILQKSIDIKSSKKISLKRNKIKDSDIIEALKKVNLYSLFEKFIKNPDYLIKKELEEKIDLYINLNENIYLTETNISDEVLEFFNYSNSYYLSLKKDFVFESELNQYFSFKISNKKLKEFIKNQDIQNLNDIGIEKKEILILSNEVSNLESLKSWEKNNLLAVHKQSSFDLSNYLKKIKKSYEPDAVLNIKKNIRRK